MSDKSKRKGKFIGAYIDGPTKKKLDAIARAEDRPLCYIVEKILAEGVKHLTEAQPEHKAA